MAKIARVGFGLMLLDKDKVLLGRRNDDPVKAGRLLHGEGTWTMPGGKLDFGEKLHEGALRELKEETGMDAGGLEVISVTDDIVYDSHFVTIGFLCRNFKGQPNVMEPDEIVEWSWFSLDELPEKMYPPSLKIVKHYMKKVIYDADD